MCSLGCRTPLFRHTELASLADLELEDNTHCSRLHVIFYFIFLRSKNSCFQPIVLLASIGSIPGSSGATHAQPSGAGDHTDGMDHGRAPDGTRNRCARGRTVCAMSASHGNSRVAIYTARRPRQVLQLPMPPKFMQRNLERGTGGDAAAESSSSMMVCCQLEPDTLSLSLSHTHAHKTAVGASTFPHLHQRRSGTQLRCEGRRHLHHHPTRASIGPGPQSLELPDKGLEPI